MPVLALIVIVGAAGFLARIETEQPKST